MNTRLLKYTAVSVGLLLSLPLLVKAGTGEYISGYCGNAPDYKLTNWGRVITVNPDGSWNFTSGCPTSSPQASTPQPAPTAAPTPTPEPTPTPAPQSGSINSVDSIIGDMTLPGDGKLHGVPPNYSWASCKGGVDDPNDSRGFSAATGWGQLYEDAAGNPSPGTRVQLRNMKTYVLSKSTGKWNLLQSSNSVSGAAFIENYSNNTNKPADIRNEGDGISVTAGGGYNFHFWPNGPRANINASDLGGLLITVQARTIGNDAPNAKYLLNVGGDWWLNTTAGWDNFKTNGGIGGGRCKAVKPEWQSFNMTTLSPDEIRTNPPPSD